MSEASKVNITTPAQGSGRYIAMIVVVVLFLVILGYFSGYLILPGLIESAYQNKNCESVLNLEGVYTRAYPSIMINKSITDPVKECAVYALALTNEEKMAWRDSYNAFQVYSESYPQGLFSLEAHEHSAVGLMGLTKEEIDQKQYAEAVGNLNIILSDYKDTTVAKEVDSLFPEIYTAWGTDLRAVGDFAGAERIFNDFEVWSANSQTAGYAKSAQQEMAQTYLAWGLALQSQKQFEGAKSKLDTALSMDPEPQSNSGPASQVKANQAKFYGEWGDYLVEQKDFVQAIEKYRVAISLSENNNQTAAADAVANGYIQWAADLSAVEDFLGALKQMDLAQENAATEAMKKSVDDTRSGIYLAFSNSSGDQAKQAMQDALKKSCELGEKPDLPIFGLDKENILAGIYGVDTKLPDEVAATTPGAMHYIACIEVVEETIQFVDFYSFLMFRIRISWDISVHDVETGKLIETYRLVGEDPVALPTEPGEIAAGGKTQKYVGNPPDIANLADWLVTVMK